MSQSVENVSNFYADWTKFTRIQLNQLENSGKELTYKDYLPYDTLNSVQTTSVKYFADKFGMKAGDSVVDIGAGLGGPCRMIAAEYQTNVTGLEYVEELVTLGNEISKKLSLPEYLQKGDVTLPMPVCNQDWAILHGVLNAVPRQLRLESLRNTYDVLRPGGMLFYEDICYDCIIPDDVPEAKRKGFDTHPHLWNGEFKRVMRQQLIATGFEIVEYEDVSRNWSTAAWQNANDLLIPIVEDPNVTLDPVERRYMEFLAWNKPLFYCDLRHMTVEQLRERYPNLCRYVDPAEKVHGVTHTDIRQVRFIVKRPEDS